jgi:hypothetical protein
MVVKQSATADSAEVKPDDRGASTGASKQNEKEEL